jgi:3-deoxy-D-arabino-heptulosonate 7-phosphate (DAHP) synthase
MQVLMKKNNFGTITDEEYLEQAGYVERAQRLMVRKGEAMVILTERGHTVRREDLPVYDR